MAAVLAGGFAGSIAGLVGAAASAPGAAAAKLVVATLAVLMVFDGFGLHVPVLQRDRETPKTWVDAGRVRWATYTGAALGFGALTRLGFLAWYLIPLTAFLSRAWWAGAAIWATYGAVRTAASLTLGWWRLRSRGGSVFGQARLLSSGRKLSRRATDYVGAALAFGLVAATHLSSMAP